MSKIVPIKKPPLTIVNWEVGVDLRDLKWTRRQIQRLAAKYKLQNGQAVVFFNNSREFGGSGFHPPKARLVWQHNGVAVMIIPPVDEGAKQVSYQLLLNEWLRASFSCPGNLVEAMQGFDSSLERRLAARQAANRRAS